MVQVKVITAGIDAFQLNVPVCSKVPKRDAILKNRIEIAWSQRRIPVVGNEIVRIHYKMSVFIVKENGPRSYVLVCALCGYFLKFSYEKFAFSEVRVHPGNSAGEMHKI